jgi:hypothetical protein
VPGLVEIVVGDPRRVVACSGMAAAAELGARDSFHEDPETRTDDEPYGALTEFARLAAEGRFTVPVAGAFPHSRTGARPSKSA